MNNDGLRNKIAYRLVKTYIAGSTMGSMLKTVRAINDKGMHATVTLLNDNMVDPVKAKYNLNAYMHMVRQISRLRLNSRISLRPVQLGYGISRELFIKNLNELASVAKSEGIHVWVEEESTAGAESLSELHSIVRNSHPNVGISAMVDQENMSINISRPSQGEAIRLWYPSKLNGEGKENQKFIERLASAKARITISTHDLKWMSKMLQSNWAFKRNITLEIPLGYGAERMEKPQKTKTEMGIYVPYGKDWVQYIRGRFNDGNRRGLALKVLTEEKGETNGKAARKR